MSTIERDDDALPPAAELLDDEATAKAALREKLIDAMTPGFAAEFDPDEAERAGAFQEDALSEQDALQSAEDLGMVPEVGRPITTREV